MVYKNMLVLIQICLLTTVEMVVNMRMQELPITDTIEICRE